MSMVEANVIIHYPLQHAILITKPRVSHTFTTSILIKWKCILSSDEMLWTWMQFLLKSKEIPTLYSNCKLQFSFILKINKLNSGRSYGNCATVQLLPIQKVIADTHCLFICIFHFSRIQTVPDSLIFLLLQN